MVVVDSHHLAVRSAALNLVEDGVKRVRSIARASCCVVSTFALRAIVFRATTLHAGPTS